MTFKFYLCLSSSFYELLKFLNCKICKNVLNINFRKAELPFGQYKLPGHVYLLNCDKLNCDSKSLSFPCNISSVHNKTIRSPVVISSFLAPFINPLTIMMFITAKMSQNFVFLGMLTRLSGINKI